MRLTRQPDQKTVQEELYLQVFSRSQLCFMELWFHHTILELSKETRRKQAELPTSIHAQCILQQNSKLQQHMYLDIIIFLS